MWQLRWLRHRRLKLLSHESESSTVSFWVFEHDVIRLPPCLSTSMRSSLQYVNAWLCHRIERGYSLAFRTLFFSSISAWRPIILDICARSPFICIEWTIATIWISTTESFSINWARSAWKSSYPSYPWSISSLSSSADASCTMPPC